MNRADFLTMHGADPERWADRHGLTPFTRPCEGCGEPMTTTVPIARGTLRGLSAVPCACGSKDTPPYCVVRLPGHGDLFTPEAE